MNRIKPLIAVLLCASMIFAALPYCRALGKIVYSGADGCGKRIALTFDDGPHPCKTGKILDLLSLYGIRATFFVVGENAGYYPDIILRESAEGHEIGNHTYYHKPLRQCKPGEMEKEISKTSEIIRKITGRSPSLFRPPEGSYSCKTVESAKTCGCDVILWNVDTRDWALCGTKEIVANVKTNVRDGSIILFHDFTREGSHTVDALKILIPYLIDSGYEFVTVSEIIK